MRFISYYSTTPPKQCASIHTHHINHCAQKLLDLTLTISLFMCMNFPHIMSISKAILANIYQNRTQKPKIPTQ